MRLFVVCVFFACLFLRDYVLFVCFVRAQHVMLRKGAPYAVFRWPRIHVCAQSYIQPVVRTLDVAITCLCSAKRTNERRRAHAYMRVPSFASMYTRV